MEQIPELAKAQEQARLEASLLISSLKPEQEPGAFEDVALTADPITAAERILAAEYQYGKDSYEYHDAYLGAVADSRRALGEAYRKTTWEYFPPTSQHYDWQSGHYTAFGRSLMDVVADGLRWDEHQEERQRLINDYSEEVSYHEFGRHEKSNTHWVLTISPCPDHAIDNPNQNYSYVPGIEKMMIRGVHFTQNEYSSDIRSRQSEQVALAGKIIDQTVILKVLAEMGAISSDAQLDKTTLHGTQFLVDKSKLDGVLDFVEKLDQAAGDDVFMGEWNPEIRQRDYAQIKIEGHARQNNLEAQSHQLTEFMLALARQDNDHVWAAGMIEAKVNQMIHKRASTNPLIARQAFDETTAKGYEQAIYLDRIGDFKAADTKRAYVELNAPPAAYCGAGSCGLRAASVYEHSQGEMLGLSGPLILDTVRRCPNGHSNAILYDSKGSKVCRHCHLKQIKGKKVFKQKKQPRSKKNRFWR